MATSFLDFKEDWSPFDQADFARCIKEMRPLACKLAAETDLSRYQPTYNMENAKVKAPWISLLQRVSILLPLMLIHP